MMEIRIAEDFYTRELKISCLDLSQRPKVAYWVDTDKGPGWEELKHIEVPEDAKIPLTRITHDAMQLGAWDISKALAILLPALNLK